MTTNTPLNGVNLDALAEMGENGRKDRSTTKFSFGVSGSWDGGSKMTATTGAAHMGGFHDTARAGRFTMTSDEPIPLGSDAGPNPVEYALQALAACYTVGLATTAAQRGIVLDSYTIDIDGDVDLAAFFGVDATVTPGLTQIRAAITATSSNADRQQLEDLVAEVERTSTVRYTLAHPVEVITHLK